MKKEGFMEDSPTSRQPNLLRPAYLRLLEEPVRENESAKTAERPALPTFDASFWEDWE
jgi:hypothetical protein